MSHGDFTVVNRKFLVTYYITVQTVLATTGNLKIDWVLSSYSLVS
jgi:hypothetical protein